MSPEVLPSILDVHLLKEPRVTQRGEARLKKSSLSYSLYNQLSYIKSLVKIGPAIPEINGKKMKDKKF